MIRTIAPRLAAILAFVALAAACGPADPGPRLVRPAAPAATAGFPPPDRPVARIVSDQYATEDERDRLGEAERAAALLGVRPGMAIADVGAGRGYYTIRFGRKVGPEGRIYANDLYQSVLDRLAARAKAEGLANVTAVRGAPDDARLPPNSVDLALLVRMYHEIEQPYALAWRLRAALKPGGRVAIIEGDRPVERHGMPPDLLRCELAAVGFREVAFHRERAFADGYLAVFEPVGAAPAPEDIVACRSGG